MAMRPVRKIKSIQSNGTTSVKWRSPRDVRVHGYQAQVTHAGGANTLAALCALLTVIVRVGNDIKWELTGTQLRDFCLLHGTTFDFNGVPNTGAQITIPLAPEWFFDSVQDALAWNPVVLGGEISCELTTVATNITVEVWETVSYDLSAQSRGILTLEVIKPIAGSTEFFVEEEIEPRGGLVLATIYPDSTNTREITPVTLFLGSKSNVVHEALTSAQNDELLERTGLTPAATGRTANVYDIAPVLKDMISRAFDLSQGAILKVGGADVMGGTCNILLARVE